MKTKTIQPFIGSLEVEVEPGMWRKMWYVMWRGCEYAKYNTYAAAEKDRANLSRVDQNESNSRRV